MNGCGVHCQVPPAFALLSRSVCFCSQNPKRSKDERCSTWAWHTSPNLEKGTNDWRRQLDPWGPVGNTPPQICSLVRTRKMIIIIKKNILKMNSHSSSKSDSLVLSHIVQIIKRVPVNMFISSHAWVQAGFCAHEVGFIFLSAFWQTN